MSHVVCYNLPTPDPCCWPGHALAQYSHLPPMKPCLCVLIVVFFEKVPTSARRNAQNVTEPGVSRGKRTCPPSGGGGGGAPPLIPHGISPAVGKPEGGGT